MPAVVIMGSPLLASVMAGPPLKLSSPRLVKQLQALAQGTARRVGLLILFLLRRSTQKYRPGCRRRYVQVRGCSPLRREPLLGKAVSQACRAGSVAGAEERRRK